MTSQVQVRDRVIWTRHIHGNQTLKDRLARLRAGQTVRLRVAGVSGVWEKLRDKPGDRGPTPGLKPLAEAKDHWRTLFESQRGHLVEITEEGLSEQGWVGATDAEREAAWEAFLALTKAGWRSERPYGDRDELHERRE